MNLRPQLAPIQVPLDRLLLDPNNPRFLEGHVKEIEEKDFANSGVQQIAADRMGNYSLDELEQSITTNGWQPVDMIFVKRLSALPDHYVVLEGNRRLMALRHLKRDGKLTKELAGAVDPLRVLEVKDAPTLEESRAQVAYLLGVRHHGSLKRWSAFAQARNIYERYVKIGKMTDATFTWDPAIATRIAKTISVDVSKIQERLRVYRAMEQLEQVPAIRIVGVKGRYYSLVKEAVAPRQSGSLLKSYIVQDSQNFRLTDDSLQRMDAVCHFSTKDRANAPINTPEEWRPLATILKDNDPDRRDAMIQEIETGKRHPSDVLAQRQAELRQPRWDQWLEEVTDLLRRLTIGSLDAADTQAQSTARRLAAVLDTLEPKPVPNTVTKEVS